MESDFPFQTADLVACRNCYSRRYAPPLCASDKRIAFKLKAPRLDRKRERIHQREPLELRPDLVFAGAWKDRIELDDRSCDQKRMNMNQIDQVFTNRQHMAPSA